MPAGQRQKQRGQTSTHHWFAGLDERSCSLALVRTSYPSSQWPATRQRNSRSPSIKRFKTAFRSANPCGARARRSLDPAVGRISRGRQQYSTEAQTLTTFDGQQRSPADKRIRVEREKAADERTSDVYRAGAVIAEKRAWQVKCL